METFVRDRLMDHIEITTQSCKSCKKDTLTLYWLLIVHINKADGVLVFSVGFNLIKIRIGLSIQNIHLTEAISLNLTYISFTLLILHLTQIFLFLDSTEVPKRTKSNVRAFKVLFHLLMFSNNMSTGLNTNWMNNQLADTGSRGPLVKLVCRIQLIS
jgi:hypothetical protein